ncbi:cell division protein FtsL [Rhizobium sp. G187]|uniref:cell division protein FtsL n=1 Tax=unclassified Rhizobium TaxID=2613769 RepID=UPI0006B950F8|nr:hypothetical protein [Rhizobium sp. AAP43]KPF42428.1 hypothetical protein IP76_17450 [Rhizobium sp. AAP43]
MLKTFDLLLIGTMLAAATITYQIKHDTDNKAAEVRRLEAEIKLEKDTIELLKADHALLTQPNRLERLVHAYATELQLEPTAPTQLARPVELPMPKSETPESKLAAEELAKAEAARAEAAAVAAAEAEAEAAEAEAAMAADAANSDPVRDLITTGSVDN